jgi:2-iminobutanoate/2-iminopropanoate deaminase
MTKQAIISSKLASVAGPFSANIRAGDYIYVISQIGQVPAIGRLIEGGVERQMQQVLEDLPAVLDAAGKSFADVVRVGSFLTDMASFGPMNAIHAKHFNEPYPARTTAAVAALPFGAAIEIDMVVKG